MRRIYDSEALRRDEGPHTPRERDRSERPQSIPWVNASAWSRRLVPERLRYRAISVEIETPRPAYSAGSRVPFAVTMRNALPVPIMVPTPTPVLWDWHVDGVTEASHVPLYDPPEERRLFRFDRGERKRFTRRWDGTFRVSDSEWERAEPGEYTLGAGLRVEDPDDKGVYDETTVRITPD